MAGNNNDGMTTLSGTGVETTANVGNYAENSADLEDINTAARYADISHQWAVSEELVDDGDNPLDDSSRTWAGRSQEEADRAKEISDGIQDVADDADRAEAAALESEASAAAAAASEAQTALDVIQTGEDVVETGANVIETGEDATSAEEDALRAELAADRAEAAGAGSTGVIGEMKWFPTDHTNPTIRSGYIMPLGQELLRAGEYSALYSEVLQGRLPSVTEAEWQAGQSGVYSLGDGSTTFRMPNMAGQFLRIAGSADPDFSTRLIGEIQVDEVGGHEHVTTNTLAAASTFLGDLFTPTALSTFVGGALGTHAHTSASHTHANTATASAPNFTGTAYGGHTHNLFTDGSGGADILSGQYPFWYGSSEYKIKGTTTAPTGSRGKSATAGGFTPAGSVSAPTVTVTNVGASAVIDSASAGTPTGTVSTTVDAATPTGSVTTTLSGDVIVAPSTGAETRPTNMYIQPYIVYAASAEVAGLQIRGIWDVPNNVITGDTLNFSITKDVAPVVPQGGFTNGVAYRVVVGGDFDLNEDPTLETINVGDYVVWYGAGWIQLSSQPVVSVNTETGDVVIHGENANIDLAGTETIKANTDALAARILALESAPAPVLEGIAVGGMYLSMNSTTPDVDLGYGTWALVAGDATLSFGDGTVRDGVAVGDNSPVVPVPQHSHTSASHTHANTVADTISATQASHYHNIDLAHTSQQEGGGGRIVSGSETGQAIINPSMASVAPIITVNGGVTIANVGASAVIDNAGTAGATLDVRGARISINIYKRTA